MHKKADYHFLWRKLHSLTGIIPLGVFLFVHLYINSFALKSADAFNEAAGFMTKLPYLIVIELVVIFIPLIYHGAYGIAITWQSEPNNLEYPWWRNLLYLIQRITGVIAAIFVIYHVYITTISIRYIRAEEVSFNYMSNQLSNPLMMFFYIIGLASVVYHFSNGIWNFSINWGITVGRHSQRIFGWVCFIVGLAFFIMGVNALWAFLGGGIRIFNG